MFMVFHTCITKMHMTLLWAFSSHWDWAFIASHSTLSFNTCYCSSLVLNTILPTNWVCFFITMLWVITRLTISFYQMIILAPSRGMSIQIHVVFDRGNCWVFLALPLALSLKTCMCCKLLQVVLGTGTDIGIELKWCIFAYEYHARKMTSIKFIIGTLTHFSHHPCYTSYLSLSHGISIHDGFYIRMWWHLSSCSFREAHFLPTQITQDIQMWCSKFHFV